MKYDGSDAKFKKSWEYQQKRLNQENSLLREQNRALKEDVEQLRRDNQLHDEEATHLKSIFIDKDKEANKHMRQIKFHEEKIQKLEQERLAIMPAQQKMITNGESGSLVQNSNATMELESDGKPVLSFHYFAKFYWFPFSRDFEKAEAKKVDS